MTIPNLSEDEFRDIVAANLTPSEEIKTPERLFGRDKNLTLIDRALNSAGRQIFIFGDRGVGKTSLAVTAAHLHTKSAYQPVYVPCGRESTFSRVIQAVGQHTISIKERMERAASGRGLNLTLPYVGNVGFSGGSPSSVNIPAPQTVDEALDVIRYFAQKYPGRIIVVIDEMERIESTTERDKFAEFIKNIPSLGSDVRFIFCGIASDIDELLNHHPSAGRILEAISLERLHHDYLWKILTTVAEQIGVDLDREILIRTSQISDGFPHFVHLIGDTMFWKMFDDEDPVATVLPAHFKAGIKGALERSDVMLRTQYNKATKKTRNTDDYEETLWALADTTSDRRQLQEIYDSSYVRIMGARKNRATLAKEVFNQRLLTLRAEGHGRIIVGHGSGWFSFRENIMRGYVRLQAEEKGVSLGRS